MTKSGHIYFVDYHSHGDHAHFNLSKTKPHGHHYHHNDHKNEDGYDEEESERKKRRSSLFSKNRPSKKPRKKGNTKKKKAEDCDPCEDHDHGNKNSLGKKDEGCPCCAAAIDLDEVAAAVHEIASGTNESGGHSADHLHDVHVESHSSAENYYSSPEFWGIFLGISGPLALVGLTAALRNVKGTINNRSKLKKVIKGLNEDIQKYKDRIASKDEPRANKEDLRAVVQRLEAFKSTLKYSKFDANFNLAVPGVINGAASAAVLSTSIVSSPWALPLIALYAGCQTMRNGYDLWRTWNKILPENVRDEVELNMQVGKKKINQITRSKRKFYAANTGGFSTFTIGASLATAAVVGALAPPVLFAGIGLLGAGALATGYLNNIWTNKFKPRNADLGIDREKLHLENIPQEIGERRELKKLLKNYRDLHLPKKRGSRIGYSLKAALPFKEKTAAKQLHKVNQSRVAQSDARDKDRLDLLERMINIKKVLKSTGNKEESSELLANLSGLGNVSSDEREGYDLVNLGQGDSKGSVLERIFEACKKLELDKIVLEKFIKNEILHSEDEHDTSVKNKEQYFSALKGHGDIFEVDEEHNQVIFNVNGLKDNKKLKKSFMNAFEEALLLDHVEKLKYEQYGLNDFYWALSKQNKKNSIDQTDVDFEKIKNKDHRHHEEHSCGHHHHRHDRNDGDHPHGSPDNHHGQACDGHHHGYGNQDHSSSDQGHGHHKHHGHGDQGQVHHKHHRKHHSYVQHKGCSHSDVNDPLSMKKGKEELLTEFKSAADQEVASDKSQRVAQVREQNDVIDDVKKASRKFILKSRNENREKGKIIYTYSDPYHPEDESKDVTYIQDKITGKVDVVYGENSKALIIERPDEEKNGVITKISKNKVKHFGKIDKIKSIFQSFCRKGAEILDPGMSPDLHSADSLRSGRDDCMKCGHSQGH